MSAHHVATHPLWGEQVRRVTGTATSASFRYSHPCLPLCVCCVYGLIFWVPGAYVGDVIIRFRHFECLPTWRRIRCGHILPLLATHVPARRSRARACVLGMVVALFSAAAAGAPASSAAQGVVPNSHVWDGTRWKCATDCDEVPCNRSARASSSPMQAQFDRNGFVILRDVLPSSVVDTMANSVNEYIARRGPMLTSRSIAFPGYLVLGVHREPPLYHLFEWLHGSRLTRNRCRRSKTV